MQQKEKSLGELIDDVKAYLDNRVELIRLVVVERSAKLIADVLTQTTVIFSCILAFLFGSVTLALYLSDVLGSYTRGFGCVSLIYLFIAIIVMVTKDKFIEKWIVNIVIRKYFKKHLDEEADPDEKRL